MAKCADTTVQTEADVPIGILTKKTATADSIADGMNITITLMKDRGVCPTSNICLLVLNEGEQKSEQQISKKTLDRHA